MKVLVCGGRDFNNQNNLFYVLDWFSSQNLITQIIQGGARGADSLAGFWAQQRNISINVFPANWNKHGKSAGYIRNQQMLDEGKPDMVVAFPGGRGTDMMVKISRRAGVVTHQLNSDGQWS